MPVIQEIQFVQFLEPKNILCRMQATCWQDAITELACLLHRNEGGFDLNEVVASCIRREEATSTVIAPRLALPHARVKGLDRVLVAIGTLDAGILFASPDHGLVQVVILILTPHEDPGLYLQVLAALTRNLGAPGAPDQLAEYTSADEIYHAFVSNGAELPPYLKAQDLMERAPVTLLETDYLKDAIETFCTRKVMDITIIDEERDVRGVLSVEDILRHSLPGHLLWMHDLSPILRFEPFADLLKRDHDSKIADYMREEYVSAEPGMPAVQLAKLFINENVRQIVVRNQRRLAGIVDLHAFMAKLFWR